MDPYHGQPPWGVVAAIVLVGATIATIGTWPACRLLLTLYRRSIAKGMQSKSGAPTADREEQAVALLEPARPIAVREVGVADGSLLLERARGQARRAQLVFGVAGAAYGVAAAVAFTVVGGDPWRPVRLVAYACVFAWPLVPTLLTLSMSTRRIRLLAWPVYLAATAVLVTLAGENLGEIVFLIFPVVFVAGTSARPLRGAAWLVAPVLLMLGVTIWAWRLVLRFHQYGAPPDGFYWGAVVAGVTLPFVALGYVWVVSRLYRAKQTSDQTLLIVQWWFMSSLWWMVLFGAEGGFAMGLALVPYLIFVGLLVLGLRIPAGGSPVRLLLLRTFGARERTSRLLTVLTRQWRWIGSVELITAPDLASETLEPDEFLDFLLRRLSGRFVSDTDVVSARLAARDLRPDRDGRYRVNELMCTDATWQLVFEGLVVDVDVVLIDLRAFGRGRLGVRHELERVVAVLPLTKVVAIVDASTDRVLLAEALARAAALAPASSPVQQDPTPALRTVGWERGRDVRAQLMAAVAGAAGPGTG
jgi:hypothetical protein